MVSRLSIVIGWSTGALRHKCVMPPVVLLSVGANHLHYALRNHPLFSGINLAVRALREAADVSI